MSFFKRQFLENPSLFAGVISSLFVLVLSWGIYNENYIPYAIPYAIAIALLALFSLDKLMIMVAFLTPLSIKLSEVVKSISFDMDLPTEPLLLGITFVFILKFISEKSYNRRILLHPISISIFIYIFWQLFTTLYSSMPVVSVKNSISKLWFIIPFYFLTVQLFRNKDNIKRYFIAYTIGMSLVALYTLIIHATHHFAHGPAHWVMSPFFIDHTSYGATLAFILPLLFIVQKIFYKDFNIKFLLWSLIALLATATVFSYTRAAWLGLAGAGAVWVILVFRIKIKYIIIPTVIILGLAFLNKDQVIIALSQNDSESSTSFSEHITSMTNITSDASNLERLNRWSCAYRMFLERPIVGWGPGTYMFQYAPFQLSHERSLISTNAADLGNAHSEYLGPLAESGLIGMLSVIAIIVVTITTALRVFNQTPHFWAQQLVLYALLGLVTYYVHGFLNNFLDTDKITGLFWPATAVIVVLDLFHTPHKKQDLLGANK